MNVILLSGGSGKRLWPLSNDVKSKQFLKLFDDGKGKKESMVQRMYHKIREIDKNATITVATSKSQISELKNQLGDNLKISLEPCRKDTFPAIALASCYLHDCEHINEEEPVVVCPVDPYVDDSYFEALISISKLAEEGKSNLVLMGIEPTYPSEKYGYIIPKTKDKVSKVLKFKEKPVLKDAEEYLKQGALWNGGIFAFKLKYLIQKAHELISFTDYKDFLEKYPTLNKISFDYAVAEKEPSIEVMRFPGRWEDMGSWNTLTECMDSENLGNVIIGKDCQGNHVVNSMNVPVLCVGVKDLIVASSPEGILVTNKLGSTQIKSYVEKMDTPIMEAEKSWGEYHVIDIGKDSMTIKIDLKKGHRMSYHSHEKRDESWTILCGTGITVVDGITKRIGPGDVISMKAGIKHSIQADSDLELIEIQLGKDIDAKDKKKFPL